MRSATERASFFIELPYQATNPVITPRHAGFGDMNLGSKALVIIGSLLSIVPFTNGCFCIGLPVGIWAIIALNNQVVRDGYAALARRANSRYEE